MVDTAGIHETVRERYAEAAKAAATLSRESVAQAGCCNADGEIVFGDALYSANERGELPQAAVVASLGCGNPTAVADLRAGETVLDLGSGGGIDVLLSARRVGASGRAIGIDMTDEMLELARRNAVEAGATNVDFLKGTIEDLPIPDSSVDVIISNCVINLAADKGAVFREIARVLRPGGRVGVSDVVADDDLSVEDRAQRGSYVGCIAGALSFAEFHAGLEAVGLTDVEIRPTNTAVAGLHNAIIRAVKPADWTSEVMRAPAVPLPTPRLDLAVLDGGCCGAGGCC
jgi:arsenite methyltransferase